MLQQLTDLKDSALVRIQQPGIHLALAEIALAEHRPRDAIREFRQGYRLPDGPVGDPVAELADLGRAFDQAGQPDSTIVMFGEYLRTPSWNRLPADGAYLPLVRERLGELYEAKDDVVNAARHYREFIELWRNADPELLPRVAAATRRLAQLTGRDRQGPAIVARRSP